MSDILPSGLLPVADAHLIPSETIDDLLAPLHVAILLGAEVSALVGTYGYILLVMPFTRNPADMEIHGIFQTEDAAKRRHAQIIVNRIAEYEGSTIN